MINSPVVPLTPRNTPSSHRMASLPSAFPTGRLFQSTVSPNSIPDILARFPLLLSYAVLPSLPTSHRFSRYPEYSISQGQIASPMLSFSDILSSSALRMLRIIPSTDWIPLSTTPLLWLAYVGLCSGIVSAPPLSARIRIAAHRSAELPLAFLSPCRPVAHLPHREGRCSSIATATANTHTRTRTPGGSPC